MHPLTAALVSILPLVTQSIGYKVNIGSIDYRRDGYHLLDNAIWIDGEDPCNYVQMGNLLTDTGEAPWAHDQGWFTLHNVDTFQLRFEVFDESHGTVSLFNADGSFRSQAIESPWYGELECEGTTQFWVKQEAQFKW